MWFNNGNDNIQSRNNWKSAIHFIMIYANPSIQHYYPPILQTLQFLQKKVILITKLKNLVSEYISISSMKTSVKSFNLIKAIVHTIIEDKKSKTYRSVNDSIWPYISNFVFFSPFRTLLRHFPHFQPIRSPHVT